MLSSNLQKVHHLVKFKRCPDECWNITLLLVLSFSPFLPFPILHDGHQIFSCPVDLHMQSLSQDCVQFGYLFIYLFMLMSF